MKKKAEPVLDFSLLEREVGQRIRDARKRARLTQTQLSQKSKINRTSLVQIENGEQQTSVRQLFAIAYGLAVDPKELLPDVLTIKDSLSKTYKDVPIDTMKNITVSDLDYVYNTLFKEGK